MRIFFTTVTSILLVCILLFFSATEIVKPILSGIITSIVASLIYSLVFYVFIEDNDSVDHIEIMWNNKIPETHEKIGFLNTNKIPINPTIEETASHGN